jgi:hypothetical protein
MRISVVFVDCWCVTFLPFINITPMTYFDIISSSRGRQNLFSVFTVHRTTISLTHAVEPFLRSRQLCSYSITSQHFMEPEASLVFTRTLHWSLSWARSIESIPSHPIYLRSILILSTQIHFGIPSALFPLTSPPIPYMQPLLPIRATCPVPLILLDLYNNINILKSKHFKIKSF